jgi:hypothetical protein
MITLTLLPRYQVATRRSMQCTALRETWRHPLQIDWDMPIGSINAEFVSLYGWEHFIPSPRALNLTFTGPSTAKLELFDITMDKNGHGSIHLLIDEAIGDAGWKNPPFDCGLHRRPVRLRFRLDSDTVEKELLFSVDWSVFTDPKFLIEIAS